MQGILEKKLEADSQKLIGMTLWKRIISIMIEERRKYSRQCEVEKSDIRYQQGVLFGLDIFLGRVDEKGTKRKSILEKACKGVPE